MARTFSVWLYIVAFVLTVVVFSFGLTLGLLIEKERLQAVDQINVQQEIDVKSLQLQQIYLNTGEVNCEALNTILEANINEVSDSMEKVVSYNKNSLIDSDLFSLQLRDYFLTEIRFLLLSSEIQQKCPSDAVTVIYFYDEDQGDTQGDVLNYLKEIFGQKLLVFSFDSNFKQEPLIDVLLQSYNVTVFPTVIVDGMPYYGGITADELKDYICEQLVDKPVECTLLTDSYA